MSRTNTINYLGDTLLTPANMPNIISVFKNAPDGLNSGDLPALLVCLEPGEVNGGSWKAQQLIRDDYTIGVYILVAAITEPNKNLVEANAALWADTMLTLIAAHMTFGGSISILGDGDNLFNDQLVIYSWMGTDYRAVRFTMRCSELIPVQTGA